MEKLEELLNREPGSARIQALIREREDYQADLLRLIDAQQGPDQDEVDPITGLILSSPNINHGALLANLYSGLNDGSSPMLEDDPRRPIRRYRAVKKADLGREAYHQFKTELIKSVEAAPPLWDLTNPSHHRREIKNVLWAKIAQRLGQKFHVQCTRADIEENWRSIKDTWLRKRREENMRKKAGFPLDEIPQAAQWVYWDMLSFLNKPRNACEKAGLATNLRQYGKKLPEIVAQKLSEEGQNPNNASQRSRSVPVPSADDGLEPPTSKRPHFDGAESLDQDGEGPSGSADVANFMSFILPRGEDAEESAHAVVDDEDYMEDDLEDSTDFPTNKMTPSASHSQTDSPSKASGSGSKPATHVNKSVKSGSVAQNGGRGLAATALPNGQMYDSRAPRATTSAEEVDMWGRVLAAFEQPRLRSTFTLCNEKFEEMSKKNPRLAADFEMEILTLVMKYSQKLHEK